jgi:hypothetical protein
LAAFSTALSTIGWVKLAYSKSLLEGVADGHVHGFEAVPSSVIEWSPKITGCSTRAARDLDQVAVLLDGADQGVGEEAVVDQLVAQQLQRSAENRVEWAPWGPPD